jgi:hypothetical protein
MEPECWPALRPSFKFDRQTGIFVIGSCFATNIESYLGERGYTLNSRAGLVGTGLAPGSLNKYTPASIFEEVSWARKVYDRDDTVRDSDIEVCLLEARPDQFYDLQLHAPRAQTYSEAALTRQTVYNLYRTVFTSDLVIITLGLIEAWYDNRHQRYICETPSRGMLVDSSRFEFERLSFEQCLRYLRETLEIIRRDSRPKVLLTTSPVVLSRTFTNDDVIVANMYSKAVLRAVSGQVSSECEDVEYFPSFESAVLTRNNSVWRDDLIHIAPTFVQQIMRRVEASYTDNLDDADIEGADEVTRFVGAVAAHQWAEARQIFSSIPAVLEIELPAFQTAASIMFWHLRDRERARVHLDAPVSDERSFVDSLASLRLVIRQWLDAEAPTGSSEKAEQPRGLMVTSGLWRGSRWLDAQGLTTEAGYLARLIKPHSVTQVSMRNTLVRILRAAGDYESAKLLEQLQLQ